VQLRSADVVDGDSIQLRVSDGGTAFAAYSQTPTLTAKKTVEAAIWFRVIRVLTRTTTGNMDVIIPGAANANPKAAFFITNYTLTDATAQANARIGYGATDGTRQWAVSTRSNDGSTQTSVTRRGNTTKCVLVENFGSSTFDAAFSAWIKDGIRLNFTTVFTSESFITVVLIGGTALSVRADTVNLGTSTSPQTYSAMGFEADALICAGVNDPMDDVSSSFHNHFLGFVHNNRSGTVTQRCQMQSEINVAIEGEPYSWMMADKFGAQISVGTVVHEYTMSNFTGSGFDFTSNASASSDLFGFLAFNFGGLASKVGTYNPPTSATTSTINPGFQPQFCLLGLNGCVSVDTSEGDADAGPMGASLLDATRQYCTSLAIEDVADTTNTQNISDDQAINLPDHTGAAFYAATQTSMDASGVNLSFSAAHGTSRQWIYLAIAGAAATTVPLIKKIIHGQAIHRAANF
jgi:hypothetical protein